MLNPNIPYLSDEEYAKRQIAILTLLGDVPAGNAMALLEGCIKQIRIICTPVLKDMPIYQEVLESLEPKDRPLQGPA